MVQLRVRKALAKFSASCTFKAWARVLGVSHIAAIGGERDRSLSIIMVARQDHKHGPSAAEGAGEQPAAGTPRSAAGSPQPAAGTPRPAPGAPHPHPRQPPPRPARQAAALAAGRHQGGLCSCPGAATPRGSLPARCWRLLNSSLSLLRAMICFIAVVLLLPLLLRMLCNHVDTVVATCQVLGPPDPFSLLTA